MVFFDFAIRHPPTRMKCLVSPELFLPCCVGHTSDTVNIRPLELSAPAAPTRLGYTFAGWNPAVPVTMPADNLTLVAQWAINQYTITFNSAGGSAVSPITQNFGTAISAPAAPTRVGYTFAGWNPAVPATMPAENLTLVAQWTANVYTVTFDPNGGSASNPSAIQVTYGATYGALANTSRDGYTFNGWFTAPTGGSQVTAASIVATATDHTLYARWTLITYTLTVRSAGVTRVPVTADPADYAGTTHYNKSGIVPGTQIILMAPVTSGDAPFENWSGCDSTDPSARTCSVTMNANKTVTARYQGDTPAALPGVLMLLLDEE